MRKVLQIKIVLEGITPRIWRRFLVKNNISFHSLHKIVQMVMGWGDYHLYSFYVGKEEIGDPNPNLDREITNAKKTKLKDRLLAVKQKFGYVYDFGDDWEHSLVVEKMFDSEEVKEYPVCLAGERACPPEDCGSHPGYYELMWLKKNKKHPRYKEQIVEWLGEDHDFELFDLDGVNESLNELVTKLK